MAKYEMKLYMTFDADLISLNAAGISVPKLMRIALEYRVRGKRARFFVNGCPKYELSGRKRCIHTSVTIKDKASVEFLEKEIKPRQRAAFFKAIVREALVNQAVGVYLKNEGTIRKEDVFIKRQDVGDVEDLFIFKPKKRNRDYAKEILAPSSEVPSGEEEQAQGGGSMKNRFGDVQDLSLSAQRKKAGKKKPSAEKNIPAASAGEFPADTEKKEERGNGSILPNNDDTGIEIIHETPQAPVSEENAAAYEAEIFSIFNGLGS